MSKKSGTPNLARTDWLDETSKTPLIGQYVERLGTFMDAMADGTIDAEELKAQQARVVAQLKAVEPELSDELHEKVTHLLCELSAYNLMHTLHHLVASRPRSKFQG